MNDEDVRQSNMPLVMWCIVSPNKCLKELGNCNEKAFFVLRTCIKYNKIFFSLLRNSIILFICHGPLCGQPC